MIRIRRNVKCRRHTGRRIIVRSDLDVQFHRAHPVVFALLVGIVGSLLAALITSHVTGDSSTRGGISVVPDTMDSLSPDGPITLKLAPLQAIPWRRALTVESGAVITALIAYKDLTKDVLHGVTIRLEYPSEISVVPRSITWLTASEDAMEQLDDAFSAGGVNTGNYAPLGPNSASEVSGIFKMRLLVAFRDSVSRICQPLVPLSIIAFMRSREHPTETRSQATVTIRQSCRDA